MVSWDTLSGLLEPPSRGFYQCSSCGSRFEEIHTSCPDCNGEVEADNTQAYYWQGEFYL